MLGDTIAAIATAIVPQQGSVGIVRMSGEQALAIAQQNFFAPGQPKMAKPSDSLWLCQRS
jgi:tRNA modification GTPase